MEASDVVVEPLVLPKLQWPMAAMEPLDERLAKVLPAHFKAEKALVVRKNIQMTSNVVTEVAAGAVVKLDRVRKLPGDPKKLRGRVVAPAAGWVTVTSKNLTRVDASAAPADDREDWEYDPRDSYDHYLTRAERCAWPAAKQRAKVAKLLEKEFPAVKLPAAARTSWSVSRIGLPLNCHSDKGVAAAPAGSSSTALSRASTPSRSPVAAADPRRRPPSRRRLAPPAEMAEVVAAQGVAQTQALFGVGDLSGSIEASKCYGSNVSPGKPIANLFMGDERAAGVVPFFRDARARRSPALVGGSCASPRTTSRSSSTSSSARPCASTASTSWRRPARRRPRR